MDAVGLEWDDECGVRLSISLGNSCADEGIYVGVELLIAMVLVVGMRRGGILFANTIRLGMWRGSMRRMWGRLNIRLLVGVGTRERWLTRWSMRRKADGQGWKCGVGGLWE